MSLRLFEPTVEQRAILDHRYDTGDVATIEAVAGSGNPTVLRKLVHTRTRTARARTVFSVQQSLSSGGESLHGVYSQLKRCH